MNFIHLNTTQDIGHGVTVIFLCFVVIGIAVLLDLYTGINAARDTTVTKQNTSLHSKR